jgi:hypothetical protein
MNIFERIFAPWHDSKRTKAKDSRADALTLEATIVMTHTNKVIDSYREASEAIRRHK